MSDWFKKWFSSDEYLSVYSHRNTEDAENLLSLILSNVNIPKNAKILDAACGAGRHSLLLSKMGYDVTAFDLSKSLLDIGRENSKNACVNVDFLCADIRNICFSRSFNLVLNMFTSFGYFESDVENFLFFNNVKQLLKKDGFLVLDYINSTYLRKNLVSKSVTKLDGKVIQEKRKIIDDFVVKEIEIKYQGITKVFTETVKLYNIDKLTQMFEKMGFKIFKVFGNYKGGQFSESESDRLIIIFTL
jgi:2-polyprenyl-3-methyl-5-hydroxy-6-metoxy-1,4-benzoquinol methylase